LWFVVTAVRFGFSSNRRMFHIAADEPAQLAIARWLSGGTRWNMFDHSTWRPGMATLMVPLFWFTDDTAAIMRGGLLIAAALGGLGAVILARLALRITPLTPLACVLAAGTVALSPASLSATAFVWAEGLVTVTFLGSLALVIAFYDHRRPITGIAAIVVAVLGFTAHGRMLPMVAVVAVLVIGRSLASRQWTVALTFGVVTAGWGAIAAGYAAWVFQGVWDQPGSSNTVGTVMKRLPNITENLESATGQAWNQLVATAGLFGIGLAVLVAAAARRRRPSAAEPAPATDAPADRVPAVVSPRNARLLLACTVPLVAVSMVFMSGRTRADHRIYGRYNDAILWPLLIIGIAWLVQLRRAHRPARALVTLVILGVTTMAAGYAVLEFNRESFASSVGVRPMLAGLMPMLGTRGNIPVLRVSIIAVIALALMLVAALSARRGAALAVLGVIAIALGGIRTHEALNTRLNSWEPTTRVREIDELIPPDATLGVKFVREAEYPKVDWDDQRRRIQLYQFSLPNHLVLRDRGVDDSVGPYVFAPVDDRELTAAGAKVIWKDPKIPYALWQEPTRPQPDQPDPSAPTP
jgi:hypothetical protein